MQLEVNRFILIFFGCFIRGSFELACIQCTSPIQRVSQSWDHSCLDGTLSPVPCAQPMNESIPPFKTCVSALYTLGSKPKRGEQNHLNLF